MEALAAVGVGAQLATVARLIGFAIGLISKIKRAAEMARQNRRECAHLALRVSLIAELLPHLHDPAVAQPLAALGDTLQEAHDLVVSCQMQGATGQLLAARDHAERFIEVHRRIDSHLLLIPLASHISITHRLDQILALNHTGGVRSTTMVAASSAAPYPSTVSCSLKPTTDQEPTTVSSFSCVISSSRAAESFTSTEIAMATGNFTLVLGEDSSGTLYKGRLHDGREVAVKRQGQHADQGAFVAEFEILYHLRHDHIVRLVGWCGEEGKNMLIYDYHQTRNGTLRDHLCGGSPPSPVTASWRMRIQALLGASRAIDHLHRAAVPRIIHRNISSSSILLDASWAPRVSDFGSAVWQSEPTGEEYGLGQLVGEVVGTSGYVDPVYGRTNRVSPASDVYSFGVVMLEVLTGRPPVAASSSKEGAVTLAGFVLPIIESGRLRDVLDSRPTPEPTPRQLEALELVACAAAPCLWLQGRPAMSYVVAILETALELICG